MADKRQTETQSPFFLSYRSLSLRERFEYPFLVLVRHSNTRVTDSNFHVFPSSGDRNNHRSLRRREFDGVVDEIPDDLLQTKSIAVDRHRFARQCDLQIHFSLRRLRSHCLNSSIDAFEQVDRRSEENT